MHGSQWGGGGGETEATLRKPNKTQDFKLEELPHAWNTNLGV